MGDVSNNPAWFPENNVSKLSPFISEYLLVRLQWQILQFQCFHWNLQLFSHDPDGTDAAAVSSIKVAIRDELLQSSTSVNLNGAWYKDDLLYTQKQLESVFTSSST